MANTYVCLVDNYRRSSRQRNTYGRYLVGAKNEKEAKNRLQKAIGFGSILVSYIVQKETSTDKKLKRKEILKVVNQRTINNRMTCDYIPPRHATTKISI